MTQEKVTAIAVARPSDDSDDDELVIDILSDGDEMSTESRLQEIAPSSPTTSESNSDCSGDGCHGRRRKRARTAFSNEQISKLEKKFNQQKYLAPVEREEFAEEVGLSEMQVKTWFQNRRMKWKRQPRPDSDVSDTESRLSGYMEAPIYPGPAYPAHRPMFPSSLPRPVIPASQPQPMTTVHLQPPRPAQYLRPHCGYPMPAAVPHHYAPFAHHLPARPYVAPSHRYFPGYRVVPTSFRPIHGHLTLAQF